MKDVHCENCGRFLCKLVYGMIEITCPNSRCKAINVVKQISYKQMLTVENVEAMLKS